MTGTLVAKPGETYAFECAFGPGIRFAMLHVNDHLVCQLGANRDWRNVTAVPGNQLLL